MSKMSKVDRKELKRPDRFVARGRDFLLFLSERRRRFVPVLIGGLVLVAVVYAIDHWSTRKLEQGWTEYYRLQKLTGEDKWTKLAEFHGQAGDLRPTYFAALDLADHYFLEGRTAALNDTADKAGEMGRKAVEWYGKALEFSELLPAERQLVYINRGNAHELVGDLDAALVDYQMAVDFGGDPEGLALLNLARAQQLKGDTPAAEGTYRRITTEFLNTEYARLARNYLRQLNSPLFPQEAAAEKKSN